MSVPLLTVVAAAIVNDEGNILLSQRPEGKPMAGMWEFPGGKIEGMENPEEALVRELKEELGIRVQAMVPVTFASHAYEAFHLLMPLYLVRQWEGVPQALEKQQLRWFDLHHVDLSAMPPPDGPLIGRVRQIIHLC